jgi:RNA polymerase sigma-H factor
MHTIFSAFAEICITRQIISAVKTATRYKHAPLNSYVSIDRPVYADESERTLQDVLTGEKDLNPEELVINEEAYKDMELRMNEVLSDLEWQVLLAYLEGKSYNETAESLNRPVKSVDNALQRIKHKLEEYVHARDGRNSIDR